MASEFSHKTKAENRLMKTITHKNPPASFRLAARAFPVV
jgi:hypothetical protein